MEVSGLLHPHPHPPGCLVSSDQPPGAPSIEGWVGFRVCLDVCDKREALIPAGS